MAEQRPPRVFISYSHDTGDHQKRVLGLADRLRADGVAAEIDQYNAAPPEGWPLWCERQIDTADVVLMICTETYHRRVKGDEEWGKGLGVVWEARIIRQLLYDASAISDKFVPVLFSDASPEQIPTPIKGWTRYVVDTDDGYEELYRRLTRQPLNTRREVGKIRPLGGEPMTIGEEDRGQLVHNLPPQNPQFVGREDILTRLRNELLTKSQRSVRIQVITGLGGVGKTQTALTYAYYHLADYRMIWWLPANDATTLAASYSTLAEPLRLDAPALEQDKLIKRIRATLETSGGPWLLVFDNLEEPEFPRAFLPTTGQGHVLITSRRIDWEGIANVLIKLQVMEKGEALQLLSGRHDPHTLPAAERAEAEALAKELGYLPLALAQARAYISETGRSFASYRRRFEASRPAVLHQRARTVKDYPTSVAKTWQISIEGANSECARASYLLELLSFFAPEPLPIDVLDGAPAALMEDLRDELGRDEAIAALHRFSLLRAEAGTLTVHRLVQFVTLDGLGAARTKAHAETAVCLVKAALPRPARDPKNWQAIGVLLPHAIITAEAAERLEAGLKTAATVFHEIALYQGARGAYAEAEPLLQRALKIREKVLGPEDPDVAWSCQELAELCRGQGSRYAEAERLFKRALTLFEKEGSEHPNVARSLHALGELYHAQGRFLEAEPLLQRALKIREKAYGREHSEVAWTLQDLGRLYRDQGRYSEAEPLYKLALTIFEDFYGSEHPDVARSLHDWGAFCHDQGRFLEAEPLLQRALKIREKAYGREHSEVAWTLQDLGRLYRDQGRYTEAEPLYQRSLNIREKVFGKGDDPAVARSLHALGELYHAQGRYAEAEALYQRTLKIREKALGLEHQGVAWICQDLGRLYRDQRRFAEAEPLLKRALMLFEKEDGSEHPNVARSLHDMGVFYHDQSRFDEAEPLLKRALEIREKAFIKQEHPDVAWILQDLGRLYHAQGRFSEAEALYQRTLKIRKEGLTSDHPDMAWILQDLGRLYRDQSRFDEAEPLYQEATAISEKTLPLDHPRRVRIRKDYAGLLKQLGRGP